MAKPSGQLGDNNRAVLPLAAGLALAPLFREDFARNISTKALQQSLPVWKALAGQQTTGVPAAAIDLVRRAAGRALEDANEVRLAEARIEANPASQQLFAGKPLDEAVAAWFEFANHAQPRDGL